MLYLIHTTARQNSFGAQFLYAFPLPLYKYTQHHSFPLIHDELFIFTLHNHNNTGLLFSHSYHAIFSAEKHLLTTFKQMKIIGQWYQRQSKYLRIRQMTII